MHIRNVCEDSFLYHKHKNAESLLLEMLQRPLWCIASPTVIQYIYCTYPFCDCPICSLPLSHNRKYREICSLLPLVSPFIRQPSLVSPLFACFLYNFAGFSHGLSSVFFPSQSHFLLMHPRIRNHSRTCSLNYLLFSPSQRQQEGRERLFSCPGT